MAAFSDRQGRPATPAVKYSPSIWDSLYDTDLINGNLFPALIPSYSITCPEIESFKASGGSHCFSIIDMGPPTGSAFVCLYFHGNSSDLGDSFERMKCYSQWMNCIVFGIEYSGYGCSGGQRTQEDIIKKCVASIEYISKIFKIPYQKMILFGHSIGAALVMKMNDLFKQAFGAIILQSAFTSIKEIAVSKGVTFSSFLSSDTFSNFNSIQKVGAKQFVLIIHGEKDEIIPFRCAIALNKACPLPDKQKVLFIDRMGSHNVFDKNKMRLEYIHPFIQKFLASQIGSPSSFKAKVNQTRCWSKETFELIKVHLTPPTLLFRTPQKDCWIGSDGMCMFDVDLREIRKGISKDFDIFDSLLSN